MKHRPLWMAFSRLQRAFLRKGKAGHFNAPPPHSPPIIHPQDLQLTLQDLCSAFCFGRALQFSSPPFRLGLLF